MKTKIKIKTALGKILFKFEKEDNSIKHTVEEAIKQGADLRGAYLQGADLQGADLRRTDLREADLQGAYLRGADLRGADLRGAYLRGADLREADLRGAYLRGADLRGHKIKTAIVFTGLYDYVVIPFITKNGETCIKMGCYTRTVNEWESDFWNNPNEFPNDNSLKSNQRRFAYETAKKWLELSNKHEEQKK